MATLRALPSTAALLSQPRKDAARAASGKRVAVRPVRNYENGRLAGTRAMARASPERGRQGLSEEQGGDRENSREGADGALERFVRENARELAVGSLVLALVCLPDEHALALGPGGGPVMEEFWDNVRRYGFYFFTVVSGGLYSLAKPLVDLLKDPSTQILVLIADLHEKLRWQPDCYREWQDTATSKSLELQQAVVDSAKALCFLFMETEAAGIFGSTKVPHPGRRFFLAGNWKCNGSRASVKKLVDELNAADFDDDVDVVVCPPSVYITQVLDALRPRIGVAAQNCWTGEGGAFTGEISADQLVDVGVTWVVAGHAERRNIVGESNDSVALKASCALSQGLGVIVSVGETLYEREENFTNGILFEQLQAVKNQITDWSKVVLAYEPVWAIGTGRTCTPQQAQEVHAVLRGWIRENTSDGVASSVRIIFGASVSSANCEELARQADVDGFFVGRAAWDVKEFSAIANSVKVKKIKGDMSRG